MNKKSISKIYKRVLAFMLAFVMTVGVVPVSAGAETTSTEPEVVEFSPEILAENAMANSEQLPIAWDNDGGAAWAFDDEAHWWHTRYQNWDQKSEWEIGSQQGDGKPSETNPLWIQTGFDKAWIVSHITYLPRQNGMGMIGNYTVSVANLEEPTATPADSDFTVVKTGSLENNTDEKTIVLDEAVEATHVRITVTSVNCTGDGHLAAQNISIFGYEPMVVNVNLFTGESYTVAGEAGLAITAEPDSAVATAAIADSVVTDAPMYDHVSNTASSIDSFSSTANGEMSLSDAEFTFIASGDYWKIYNEAKNVYWSNSSSANTFFESGAAESLVSPSTEVEGAFTICKSSGSRYIIFYNTNMDFNSNSNFETNYTAGSYNLILLEKQNTVSEDDVIPGYKQATEIVDGNNYLIAYRWPADETNVFVLYPTNGTGNQTKLVKTTDEITTTAQSELTITAVGKGTTSVVVGNVTYNVNVAFNPADSSMDYDVAKITAATGSENPATSGNTEGPLSYAFDGNEGTWWHSDYTNTTWWTIEGANMQDYLWVEMAFEEATWVDAIRYLPRGAGNGNITGYRIEGTADGETWTTLTEGTWEISGWQIAEFEAAKLTAVRIVATATQGSAANDRYANAKEIRVRTAEVSEPTPEPGIEVSERVQGIMDAMTLEEKVAQMMMVDFRYWDEDLTDATGQAGFTVMNDQIAGVLAEYKFGALIYFAQNILETEQSYNLTMAVQEAATSQGGLPMIISADQEGGSVYRLGSGTALPGNMALGATGDTEYAKKAGQIIGSELSSLGINTTLAPVVDVNNNANNPVIGLRSYGDDATAVGQMAAANIQGLAQYNVIGCAKHFPGHGDTATDSHYGLPIVDKSLDVLLENELKPYEVAIEEGIEMIMTAHILYPQLEGDKIVSEKTGEAESLPATMSDDILTGLLKGDMGFEGIIVTDAMNMAGIADKWNQVQSVKIAIAAGVDMICMPCTLYNLEDLADLNAILDGVVAAVESGEIPESRINDAVARILTVKENSGILDYNAEDYTLENALATVGSDANRATEREIAAAAVTVVKNENNVLPLELTSESNVLMLVPYDNERAQMLMGWNRAVEAGIIPYGAEVDYYRFSSATINATLQEKLEWADVVIMNSEISSTARMAYKHWLSALPNAVADYCKENGKTSVIVSVDKPYDVQLYPNADAVLAAYGCKGSSVDPTEALVGGVTGSAAAYGPNIIAGVEVALGTFGAQGTLPVNIPVYDVESNTYTEEIAYARGYGLTYEAKAAIAVDKTALQAKVDEYNAIDRTKYETDSLAVLDEALAAAAVVLTDETVNQYNVDKAIADLEAAYAGLVEKTKLEIITQPTDAAVLVGEDAVVTVEAVGKGLTYTWYYKNPGNVKFYESGATFVKEGTYSIPMYKWRDGQQLYCVITDAYGNTAQTNTVTVSIKKSAAVITKDIESVTVDNLGDTVTLTVEAEGEGLTYTWYYKNPGNVKFYESGAQFVDGNTYTIPVWAWRNGQQVYCVITDATGATVQSNTVTLSVAE